DNDEGPVAGPSNSSLPAGGRVLRSAGKLQETNDDVISVSSGDESVVGNDEPSLTQAPPARMHSEVPASDDLFFQSMMADAEDTPWQLN
ncbi:hypothetical protein CPC08DRAFT_769504, partial [Agrocybe pediades]